MYVFKENRNIYLYQHVSLKSLKFPPLGSTDHNRVHLPSYKTVVRREKVQIMYIKKWNEEAVLCLWGCFQCTERDVFKQFGQFCPQFKE